MRVIENSIVFPTPDDIEISKLEHYFRVEFPAEFKDFLKRYNSCEIYEADKLTRINKRCDIVRFLGIIENFEDSPYGEYDIGVCETSLDERIWYEDEMDIVGGSIVPIAKLAWGDYLCLNYHYNRSKPTVDFLDFEESRRGKPATETMASSYTEFMQMLSEEL